MKALEEMAKDMNEVEFHKEMILQGMFPKIDTDESNKAYHEIYDEIIASKEDGIYLKHQFNFVFKDGEKWLSIFNIDGNCWVEEFSTKIEALKDIGGINNG